MTGYGCDNINPYPMVNALSEVGFESGQQCS